MRSKRRGRYTMGIQTTESGGESLSDRQSSVGKDSKVAVDRMLVDDRNRGLLLVKQAPSPVTTSSGVGR